MRLLPALCIATLSLGSLASATTHRPTRAKPSTQSAKHASTKSTGSKSTSSKSAGKRSASRSSSRGKGRGKAAAAKPVSHAAPMDTARATEIQAALIKQGYLTGEPSGKWDAQSISAMQKLQSDNGWQSKVVPDARGLIKLGLGPQPLPATPPTTAPAPQP